MIRYTNNLGMPDALARAVELDSKHTAGDISVTQLLNPVRMRQLLERHDVEIDCSDSLWALMGKSCHKAIEGHVVQSEVQLVADVDGVRVSGTIDEITGDGILRDWKMTSAWTVVFQGDSGRQEWENQLNMYAWLCENATSLAFIAPNGAMSFPKWSPIEVKGLRACMIFRDWTRSKVGGKNYPEHPWRDAEVELWKPEVRDAYIRSRVAMHKEAESIKTEDLPLCDPVDRWVNDRTGKEVRCLDYCAARSVCNHALALRELAAK